jgi:hypothetical protein
LLSAGSAVLALAALPAMAAAAPNPDAELITACDAYIRAWTSYNDDVHLRSGLSRAEADELDRETLQRLVAFERRTEDFTAKTVASVVAEARVAKCVGWNPTGLSSFDGGEGSEWTERVMWSLLRVHGETV